MIGVLATLLILGTAGSVAFQQLQRPSVELRAGGPLKVNKPDGYMVNQHSWRVFTDAFNVLEIEGSQPAALISVRSEQSGPSFHYLGARIAGVTRRTGESELFHGFPPRGGHLGALRHAPGFRLLPVTQTPRHIGYELLLGYRIVSPALGYRDDIVITYRVGKTIFRATLPSGIVNCPPNRSSTWCVRSLPL